MAILEALGAGKNVSSLVSKTKNPFHIAYFICKHKVQLGVEDLLGSRESQPLPKW